MAIYSDQEDPNHIMWNKQNEKEELEQYDQSGHFHLCLCDTINNDQIRLENL